jgi:hypothetical protein
VEVLALECAEHDSHSTLAFDSFFYNQTEYSQIADSLERQVHLPHRMVQAIKTASQLQDPNAYRIKRHDGWLRWDLQQAPKREYSFLLSIVKLHLMQFDREHQCRKMSRVVEGRLLVHSDVGWIDFKWIDFKNKLLISIFEFSNSKSDRTSFRMTSNRLLR